MSDEITAALERLTEHGVDADIRALLIHGNVSLGVPPGALAAAIAGLQAQHRAEICDMSELARLRSERGYVVGCNDGYEIALEHAAELIELNSIQDTSDGKRLIPRREGDREGLHYAWCIREFAFKPPAAEQGVS